ncbi:MAG: lactate utilization protein [Alphaproteobacteria bacterium]|jgi:L-lactate dehydrogenase complex protein LldG|nr:lactate utilization protein [Alphaproteobacteria bacterium]MDP6565051.1 lactate utilization protein [Alphaproteobacteria bacterium]MDP6815059.1 lactate utilization protein [Alphaproteobacteria bacterium]
MARRGDPGREAIFAAIRQSLGRPAHSAEARRELDDHIGKHRANLIPQRGKGDGKELVDRFRAMAEAAACTVRTVAAEAEVPGAVADYLRENNLSTRITLAPDSWLSGLDWASQPMLETRGGPARNEDEVAVTPAFAAVAETGTLVALSGPDHPTTLNFMPASHVVALRASQVVGAYEEVWQQLRKATKKGRGFAMPRAVNMITGPSRTADIALTIQLGAHGPRDLHIVLIDDQAGQE